MVINIYSIHDARSEKHQLIIYVAVQGVHLDFRLGPQPVFFLVSQDCLNDLDLDANLCV